MSFTAGDIRFMRKALSLGAKGKGSAFPNPPVGAVLVKRGAIIGSGWHRAKGDKHAEVLAIESARNTGHDTDGATMFVTLEPCCHHGATPPCVDAIISAKIARVFIACRDDFDSRVCGAGMSALRAAGIEVIDGFLENEGTELIEQYRVQRTENRAFLSLKWAQTADGHIATKTGNSQWISGERALRFAHRLRAEHGAVAVGANTAIVDNPRLTVRKYRSRHHPARVILAGDRELPASLNVLAGDVRTIVVRSSSDGERLPEHVEVVQISRDEDFWPIFLRKIFDMGIGSVLLEGGGEAITTAIRARIADKIHIAVAPRLIGGGKPAIGDLGINSLAESIDLDRVRFRKTGDDMVIIGYPQWT